MKDIKEYLHLYLGCQCEHTCWDDAGDDMPGSKKTRRTGELDLSILEDIDWFRPKLLLRPLSDMTEEEFEQFRTITGYPNHNATFEGADGVHIKYRYGKKSTVNGFKTSININSIRPDMLKYLLSRGFDLFNLVSDGLAINKTESK